MQNEKENSGVKTRYSSPKQKLHQQAEKINEEASKVEPRVRKDAGELVVIIKAKEFSKYVLNASRKMPRDHRFVVSANIQRLALSLVENLVRANGVLVQAKNLKYWQKRFDFQTQAEADLQMLEFLAMYAFEEKAILVKQYTQIVKQGAEVAHFIAKWKESDKRRFAG